MQKFPERFTRIALHFFCSFFVIFMLIAPASAEVDLNEIKSRLRKNWSVEHQLNEQSRAELFDKADCVVDGKIVRAQEGLAQTEVSVTELSAEPLNYVIFFKVEKVVKGENVNETLAIAVHSPYDSFGFSPMEYESGSELTYRIYLKAAVNQPLELIGTEMTSLAITKEQIAKNKWERAMLDAERFLSQNAYHEAEKSLETALKLAQDFPIDVLNRAWNEQLAGKIYMAIGKYPESEKFLLAAQASLEDLSPNDPLKTASILNDLARLYDNLKEFDKAEDILLRLESIYQKAYEKDSVSVSEGDIKTNQLMNDTDIHEYGRTMNRLQKLSRDRGQYPQAAPACEKTVELFAKVNGSNHSYVETITKECAEIHRLNKDYTAAANAYERALKITTANHGPQSLKNIPILEGLIAVHRELSEGYQKLKDQIKNQESGHPMSEN